MAGDSAIVFFIPTNRVEHKISVVSAAIMQRLAAKNIVWNLHTELWRECVQRFGKFPMRETMTLQRNCPARQIHGGLFAGGFSGRGGERIQEHSREKISRGRPPIDLKPAHLVCNFWENLMLFQVYDVQQQLLLLKLRNCELALIKPAGGHQIKFHCADIL